MQTSKNRLGNICALVNKKMTEMLSLRTFWWLNLKRWIECLPITTSMEIWNLIRSKAVFVRSNGIGKISLLSFIQDSFKLDICDWIMRAS